MFQPYSVYNFQVPDSATQHQSIGVVIVTFNSGQYLSQCLKSLTGSAVGVGIDLHISVVDNHPKLLDKSIAPDNVIYIPNPSNTGFGAGCNLGIRKLAEGFDPDFFMLINPIKLADYYILKLI